MESGDNDEISTTQPNNVSEEINNIFVKQQAIPQETIVIKTSFWLPKW